MGTQKKKNLTPQEQTPSTTPIAIVGLAGIFPEAPNLERYWENIMTEMNCVSEVPESRWSVADYYDADPSKPDKSYSKYGGFIPDIEFDPMEFGLPPNFLEVTDVSQLLGLIVARDALADAGVSDTNKELLDRTGVVLGMVGMSSKVIQPLLNRLQYPLWEKVLKTSSVPDAEIPEIIEKMKSAYISWNENAFPGAIGNVVAGRIANRLDLGGTNCVVDAACGSSLAAVNLAVSELALGHADMMITGGVDTDNSILTFMCFSKTPAFSKGDHLRAFSADSDGMLSGEGIGMLVMKRLADAERDNDRIYAVVRGIGTSSDGNFKSIYAPRPSGQSKALKRAYERAGYAPATVGLVEAHGTGTMAGDPAEFEGMRDVFSENNPDKQSIALGSVKSQIGHTKAAAGAASMIKATLALYHKVLPATINVSKPNPALQIESTPFYLNTETRPWFSRTDGAPRRAGVSSFGFGGTNFHVAVEEYRGEGRAFTRLQAAPFTVLLSAPNPQELAQVCQRTLSRLQGENGANILNQLDQDSYSKPVPSAHARLGFLAASAQDACAQLEEGLKLLNQNQGQAPWSHPKGIYFREAGMDVKGKTAALFPGQGSQYVNMGKDLAISFPPFRESFEQADAQAVEDGRAALTQTVYPIPVFSEEERKAQQETLTATENAQPAIGTFSMAVYRMLQSAGFAADYFAGHSFGELSALWAGGVLDDEAFLRLAAARGQAMGLPAESGQDSGTMAAVKGDVETVRKLLKDNQDVRIANYNSPVQVVLAGSTRGIQDVKALLEGAGLSVYPLKVSMAFHTPFVEHAKAPFAQAIKKETFKKAKGKVYSNASAQPYPAETQEMAQTLSEHMLNSVRFQEEIENMYADGARIFVECGPKNVLSNLVKDILKEQPYEVVTLNPNPKGDSDAQFRQAVLQLRVLGFELGNIDPYRAYVKQKEKKASKVAVQLNGGLYTTAATRAKFEEALKQNRHGQTPAAAAAAPVSTVQAAPAAQPQAAAATAAAPAVAMAGNAQIESLITRLQDHQNEILKAHQQYLQNDNASKGALQELTNTEISLLSSQNGNADPGKLGSIEKQADFIASQHSATSSAHQEYIQSQTAFTQQYAAMVQALMGSAPATAAPAVAVPVVRETAPVKEMPVPVTPAAAAAPKAVAAPKVKPTAAGPVAGELQAAFLAIVSEKTGYPVEMLELGMDMEADLGIDSIKRVEILGAVQEQYPELPTIGADELVELRTLEQIIGAFKIGAPAAVAAQPVRTAPAAAATPEPAAAVVSAPPSAEIQSAFLAIVSEKTGYPVDMLELGMDMEADLGIDSIKRVEILGAMQEQYPELPSIGADELVELRTLEQIIGAFKTDGAKAAASQALPASLATAPASETTAAPAASNAAQPATAEIQSAFLAIVSEKTGYPVDMLELSMDMEADLGIDSIKRVEILGAMQEQYPELPSISADELVELRTLEQIVGAFKSDGTQKQTEPPAAPNPNSAPSEEPKKSGIATYPVTIQALPKPDQVAFEYPQGSSIVLTDDGTQRTQALTKALQANGLAVSLIHIGKNGKNVEAETSSDVKQYRLSTVNDEAVQTLMEQVISENGKLVGFVHLEPSHNGNGKKAIDINEKNAEALKSVFLMARHLKAPLAQAAGQARPAFLTVTQMDGQFGLNGSKSSDPYPGGFAGLTKTLRLEWPSVYCRALDIHPDVEAQTAAEEILDEIHDADLRLTEVGYTPAGRFTVALEDEG
jgi:malonyl CoA-acyl carrier protein transacylase